MRKISIVKGVIFVKVSIIELIMGYLIIEFLIGTNQQTLQIYCDYKWDNRAAVASVATCSRLRLRCTAITSCSSNCCETWHLNLSMMGRRVALGALWRGKFEGLLELLILRLTARRHELLCGLMMYHRDSLMVMKWLANLVSDTIVVSTWDWLHTLAHLRSCIWWDNHWSVFICAPMHSQVSTMSIRSRLSRHRLCACSLSRGDSHRRCRLWMKFVLTEHRLVVFRLCLHWVVLAWHSDLSCISMSFLLADEFLRWWGARIDRRDLFIGRLYGDICTGSCCSTNMYTCTSLALLNHRLAPSILPRYRSRCRLRNTLVLVLDLRFRSLSLWRLLCHWLLWSSCTLLFIVGWLTVLAF